MTQITCQQTAAQEKETASYSPIDDAEEETALLASVVTEITDKDVSAATDCSLIL